MNASLATPIAALIAGLATSVHCCAMCGPLACALRVRPVEYHASRFLSYSLAGALCGAVGQSVAALLQGSTARIVPWAFAVVLIVLGLGLERRLPQPRFAASLLLRARLNRSLGWLTPLLPCGPLWLMLGAAAITGSWWSGAMHMAAFAAGTIPLPLFLQTQAARAARTFPASGTLDSANPRLRFRRRAGLACRTPASCKLPLSRASASTAARRFARARTARIFAARAASSSTI